MNSGSQNHIYVYDDERHQIVIIDGETGERIEEQEDGVVSILKHLHERNEYAKLRKFAVWCAHQTNEHIKPIQNKLIELAELAIQGKATINQLKELYDETEGVAIATDTVGLRQGSEKAPAFLATRECINPNALEGALQAARFHRLWAEIHEQNKHERKALKEIKVDATTDPIRYTQQKQIDYLLDLMQ
jgi:hypothetical protein